MEGISDIKIIGLDEKRPPKIRKEPYIDIIFKLSHQAPVDWCKDFNEILSKHPTTPNIKEKEGLYIEAWVRAPNEIAALLDQLKIKVAECNRQYIERLVVKFQNSGDTNETIVTEIGKQGLLNKIIADLDFNEIDTA